MRALKATTVLVLGLVKITIVTLLLAVVIFFIAWGPVIYKLATWCDRYPQTFADCRE
jgi:small-conductance mechanosensitive channel